MRWSSISFASLRASSTGWTWVRNARPKTPSKSASIFCSMFRSTVTGEVLPVASLARVCPANSLVPGPPQTTTRFEPIREMPTCLCQDRANSASLGRFLWPAPRHQRQRQVDRPAGDHERERAHGRCCDQRRREQDACVCRDRQIRTAGDERERPGGHGEDQRLETELRNSEQPLPDGLQDGERVLAAGDAQGRCTLARERDLCSMDTRDGAREKDG